MNKQAAEERFHNLDKRIRAAYQELWVAPKSGQKRIHLEKKISYMEGQSDLLYEIKENNGQS